ncbi:hypothetical protein ACPA9J_20585 [Pseudomonas aeruginosa]
MLATRRATVPPRSVSPTYPARRPAIEARFPDPAAKPLPGLPPLGPADGRPGRHPEQDPPRCRRQEPVRPPPEGRRNPQVCGSLKEAGRERGRASLTKGGCSPTSSSMPTSS